MLNVSLLLASSWSYLLLLFFVSFCFLFLLSVLFPTALSYTHVEVSKKHTNYFFDFLLFTSVFLHFSLFPSVSFCNVLFVSILYCFILFHMVSRCFPCFLRFLPVSVGFFCFLMFSYVMLCFIIFSSVGIPVLHSFSVFFSFELFFSVLFGFNHFRFLEVFCFLTFFLFFCFVLFFLFSSVSPLFFWFACFNLLLSAVFLCVLKNGITSKRFLQNFKSATSISQFLPIISFDTF